MINRLLIFLFFSATYSFMLSSRYTTSNCQMNMWNSIDKNFKNIARKWFISRAEKAGIDWYHLVEKNKMDFNYLKYIFNNVENKNIIYPDYYKKPFHGYDDGNLNWDAALEGDAATLSIAVNYWKNNDPHESEKWLRNNITENINSYYKKHNVSEIKDILDVGCSVGVSSEYLYNSYKNVNSITGIDLSPYFLSISILKAIQKNLPINYYHKMAESTKFEDCSYDFIVCNFLLHEVPYESSKLIINELYRILKPGGVLAIVDLDPKNVKNKLIVSEFRKWAFEVTEPHISEYYKTDLSELLKNNNFENVEKVTNDPVNSIWFGHKMTNKLNKLNKEIPKQKIESNNKVYEIPCTVLISNDEKRMLALI